MNIIRAQSFFFTSLFIDFPLICLIIYSNERQNELFDLFELKTNEAKFEFFVIDDKHGEIHCYYKYKRTDFQPKLEMFDRSIEWTNVFYMDIYLNNSFLHKSIRKRTNDRNEIKLDERAKELFCDCCC